MKVMNVSSLEILKKALLNYKVCFYCYINTDLGRPIKNPNSIPCKEKFFDCHMHKPQQVQTGNNF